MLICNTLYKTCKPDYKLSYLNFVLHPVFLIQERKKATLSETKVDMYYSLRALFLISTTITAVASRYAIKIVHIIRTTISCLDVC